MSKGRQMLKKAVYQKDIVKTLFIFPRRGLYQITLCKHCGYLFGSPESDSFLVAYRSSLGGMELVDTHSQTIYAYPTACPDCASHDILSKSGGVEELAEKLESELGITVTKRYISRHSPITTPVPGNTPRLMTYAPYPHAIDLSTRLYDPAIDYSQYSTIVILRAENLTASVDYLVHEEVYKSLCELLIKVVPDTQIIIDTASLDAPIISDMLAVSRGEIDITTLYEQFVHRELIQREEFGFPPFANLLLFTAQENTKIASKKRIDSVYIYIEKELKREVFAADFASGVLSLTPPYPARTLKRKNKFSYHCLLKFPRNYEHFSSLKAAVHSIVDALPLQIRLNPRHIF
jgi:primosomal protein N' (replication factor Y) (superfamily II helicase)